MDAIDAVTSKSAVPWWNKRVITNVTLDAGYRHETRLQKFIALHQRDFHHVNKYMRDDVFTKVTDKLVAGTTYEICTVNIQRKFTPSVQECLRMLRERHALLTGPQGLSLLWEHARGKMIPDMNYVALDYSHARPIAHDGRRGCAFIQRGTTTQLPGQFSLAAYSELDYFDTIVYFMKVPTGGIRESCVE